MMEIVNWAIGDDGMIEQSLSDGQDSSVRLFTETAQHHNQAIQDAKEKE
jgi:hypothetical protein